MNVQISTGDCLKTLIVAGRLAAIIDVLQKNGA